MLNVKIRETVPEEKKDEPLELWLEKLANGSVRLKAQAPGGQAWNILVLYEGRGVYRYPGLNASSMEAFGLKIKDGRIADTTRSVTD